MLRGVNKQIIEVKDTGSRYFERALLFVRPEFAEMRPGQLEAEANKFLATVGRPPATRPATRPTGPALVNGTAGYRREPADGDERGGPALRRPISYAARMARMRRRRRLVCAGILGLAVTAAALILLYIL